MKKRNIFAVCDLEVAYAYNFMEYVNQKRNIPFEVQAFTSPVHLCAFAREQPIELLLISDKAMRPEVKGLPIRKIIILSEGVHDPGLDQYPSVYKYQSSDSVIREVMACYGEEVIQAAQPEVLKKETKVVAVYSPVGRCQKTSFALTLGQVLAKQQAVLYINLEEYAGFEQLFGRQYEKNLSDLLYYIRQDSSNLIFRVNSMVQTFQNMDYLPPVLSPMDLMAITCEEWTKFLEVLCRQSNYQVLILDLGSCILELYSLLEQCSRIYMPVREDPVAKAKIEQFENLAQMWDCGDMLKKVKKLTLPFHNSSRQGSSYLEGLVWSQLGDYVRQLLREEPL